MARRQTWTCDATGDNDVTPQAQVERQANSDWHCTHLDIVDVGWVPTLVSCTELDTGRDELYSDNGSATKRWWIGLVGRCGKLLGPMAGLHASSSNFHEVSRTV